MGLHNLNVVMVRVVDLDLNTFVCLRCLFMDSFGLVHGLSYHQFLQFASRGTQPGSAGSLLHSGMLLLLLASDRGSCKLASYRTCVSDGA